MVSLASLGTSDVNKKKKSQKSRFCNICNINVYCSNLSRHIKRKHTEQTLNLTSVKPPSPTPNYYIEADLPSSTPILALLSPSSPSPKCDIDPDSEQHDQEEDSDINPLLTPYNMISNKVYMTKNHLLARPVWQSFFRYNVT